MPKALTRPQQFLQQLEESTSAHGWQWRPRSGYELTRGPKEPRCVVYINFGVYPRTVRMNVEAWVAFRDAEVVAHRAAGRTLEEARQFAKESGTVGRSLGVWNSEAPDFADVLGAVRDAVLGPATRFHARIVSLEAAADAFQRAFDGADDNLVILGTHAPARHLSLLYLLRDRERFDAATSGWAGRGVPHRATAERVSSFLREHWDASLAKE